MLGLYPLSEVPLSGLVAVAPPDFPPSAFLRPGRFTLKYPQIFQGAPEDINAPINVPPSQIAGRFRITPFAPNLSFQKTPEDVSGPFEPMSVTHLVGRFVVPALRADPSYRQTPQDIDAPAPPPILPPVPIDVVPGRPDQGYGVVDLRPDQAGDNFSLRVDESDTLERKPDECGPH